MMESRVLRSSENQALETSTFVLMITTKLT